jgi:hypothetical protein
MHNHIYARKHHHLSNDSDMIFLNDNDNKDDNSSVNDSYNDSDDNYLQ